VRVAVIAPLLLGACLEIPPASCPAGSDFDEDGWPCGGVAPDCDDGDPEINPGVPDDCATNFVEDCGGDEAACPPLPGLVATTASGDATWGVQGGGLSATFERGLQWVLSSLRREGDPDELLSRVTGGVEQYAGVTLYPRFDQYEVTTAVPSALDAGPAYVRIEIAWEHDTASEDATGTSVFGFFPNGTIHRHETFVSQGYTIPDVYLVTHWTLNTARFTTLDTPLGEVVLAKAADFAPVHHHELGSPDDGVLCAYDVVANRRVTMAWRDQLDVIGSRAVVGNEAPERRLALDYDWFRGVAMIPPGTFESVTTLTVDTPDQAGDACASAASLSGDLRDPPVLAIIAGVAGPDANADGYVVDEGLHEIAAEIDERFVEVRSTETVLRGMMVRAVLDAVAGVTVWRNGARQRAGRDYLVQPSDDGVTVYFPGRIDTGELLRIAAPGGEPT